jgi:hypothetical protein
MSRLNVQRDDIGNVVRVAVFDDIRDETVYVELDAEQAKQFGEKVQRMGREIETEQTVFTSEPEPPDGQSTLDGLDVGSDRKPLEALLEEDQPDADIGDVLNPNDPMDW